MLNSSHALNLGYQGFMGLCDAYKPFGETRPKKTHTSDVVAGSYQI